MPCSCNKSARKYEVVAEGGNGKVLFTNSIKSTCDAVAKRYPGSIVRENPTVTVRK